MVYEIKIYNVVLDIIDIIIFHFNLSILYHLVCIHMRVSTNIKFK